MSSDDQIREGSGASNVSLASRTKSRFLIPVGALLLYLAQCAWFIGTQSLTVDEPVNITAGLEAWRYGRFEHWDDHPALIRLICTLPVINPKYQIEKVPYLKVQEVAPSPEAMTWRTRPMNSLLGLLLGVLVWLAARRMYSEGAANLAVYLFAFSPALIAHFSLVGNDGIPALMAFATAFQLVRWRHDPSPLQTVLVGLAVGGLLLSKFSVLPLVLLTLALVLVLKPTGLSVRLKSLNWKQVAIVSIVSCGVLWAAYRFHVSKVVVTIQRSRVEVLSPNYTQPKVKDIERPLRLWFPVPAGEFLQAIWVQVQHSREGHAGYLFGRSFQNGSVLYFPSVILLKWPTILLIFCGLSTVLLALRRISLPADWAIWVLFPAVFLLSVLFTSINLGERLILPLYPFGLLLAAGLWQMTTARRVLLLVLAGLVFHIYDAGRYAPDYISYFNMFARTDSFRLLSDSNVDWGNGLYAVRKYQQSHPNETIYMAYFGSIEPAVYGVKVIPLKENERASGTVIVSANYLAGQNLRDEAGYRWLLQYPRKAILAHGLYVFDVH